MIQIQEADEKRLNEVRQLRTTMDLSEMQDGWHTLVLTDGETLCGYGCFTKGPEVGIVHELYILPEYRRSRFGDGLLRAVLNVQERSGCQTAFVISHEEDKGFYQWEQIPLAEKASIPDTEIGALNTVFQVDLTSFFNRPCRGGAH